MSLYVLLLTATILLPFGVAAGDELVPPSDRTSRPVSLSCQFYGVEEDTVYVRNNQMIIAVLLQIISIHS